MWTTGETRGEATARALSRSGMSMVIFILTSSRVVVAEVKSVCCSCTMEDDRGCIHWSELTRVECVQIEAEEEWSAC